MTTKVSGGVLQGYWGLFKDGDLRVAVTDLQQWAANESTLKARVQELESIVDAGWDLSQAGRGAMERINELEREVAELKKAAPDLIREHRKAYYDQIDCWRGEPFGPCQCPACKMERLT